MTVGTPVIFVHGMFLHAQSWAPWLESFRGAGYTATAPGWPGEAATVAEARERPGQVAGTGIDDIVAHYARLIGGLDTRPVLVGHSTGALVVQRLLVQGLATAAVAAAGFSRRSPAAVDTADPARGPLLLIAGGRDQSAPPAVVRATERRYRRSSAVTDYVEFADRGHSLPIDSNWREAAEATLAWLERHR
jgi:alpha-beta hydrolase superfamily lysophospholipase